MTIRRRHVFDKEIYLTSRRTDEEGGASHIAPAEHSDEPSRTKALQMGEFKSAPSGHTNVQIDK